MDTVIKLFGPMEDDMTSTKYHIKQIERRREPESEQIGTAQNQRVASQASRLITTKTAISS